MYTNLSPPPICFEQTSSISSLFIASQTLKLLKKLVPVLKHSEKEKMDNVNIFLESSSINGLAHIATGRRYVRLFWILVVIAGFIGAGVLIYQSFQSWSESPVKTTIETHPISEIPFPKVTVCPPKNTYTDLNYDLMMTKTMTLDNDTRNELANHALELIYDHLFDHMMTNLSKLEDNERYYNWYYGFTQIELPHIDYYSHVNYYLHTTAISSSIFTRYFGDKFDADKVETGPLKFNVYIYPPASVRNNRNVTVHFDIEKLSLKDLTGGTDSLTGQVMQTGQVQIADADDMMVGTHGRHNFSPPNPLFGHSYEIRLARQVLSADIRKQKLSLMPGFKISWHYSGMDKEEEPDATYYNASYTKTFVR